VTPADEVHLLDNLWKIVNKDFSGEGFDMLKDIKIMSDEYPFDAVMKVGGTKESSEDMNLTSEGKLTIQGDAGKKTLMASSPTYIKSCKLT
jgi:hypothetical protein